MTAHRAIAAAADASFPLRLIEEVVDRAGAREQRRRLLPAAAVMVFVLGCCLFSADSYGEVARKLACWLGPLAGRPAWHVPGSAALARARRRLGSDPFELLFTRLAGPLAGPGTPGAAAFGRVLVAIDGTSLEVPYNPGEYCGVRRTAVRARGWLRVPAGRAGHCDRVRDPGPGRRGVRAAPGSGLQ